MTLLVPVALAAGIAFPPPRGPVNDFSGAIGPEWTLRIESVCREVEKATGAQLAVVSVESVAPLDEVTYGTELFRAWGIGTRGRDDGVLILHAVRERRVRIETGYGVEGALPDAWLGRTLETHVFPAMKAGRFGEALHAASRQVADRLRSASRGEPVPAGRRPRNEIFAKALVLVVAAALIGLVVMPRLVARERSRRRRGRGSWLLPFLGVGTGSGGFSGGGFGGGGFGGFGGGASGGGGAGGGY